MGRRPRRDLARTGALRRFGPDVPGCEEDIGVTVITIAREFGAGGADVGALLADRLGVEVVDRTLIDEVARRLSLPREEVEAEDEHPRTFFDRILRAMAPMNEAVGVAWEPPDLSETIDPKDEIVAITAQVIREAARAGNAVIVGRGARFVLGDVPGAVHVFLCAPVDVRVERIAERLGVDAADARRRVTATDASRTAYVRQVHGQNWRDPVHYHVVLNTGEVTYDEAVEVILGLAGRRAGTPG